MLSVSIAFLAYEGLTRNVSVTYAKRTPGVLGASTKSIDSMASHISGRFIRDLSNTYFKTFSKNYTKTTALERPVASKLRGGGGGGGGGGGNNLGSVRIMVH